MCHQRWPKERANSLESTIVSGRPGHRALWAKEAGTLCCGTKGAAVNECKGDFATTMHYGLVQKPF